MGSCVESSILGNTQNAQASRPTHRYQHHHCRSTTPSTMNHLNTNFDPDSFLNLDHDFTPSSTPSARSVPMLTPQSSTIPNSATTFASTSNSQSFGHGLRVRLSQRPSNHVLSRSILKSGSIYQPKHLGCPRQQRRCPYATYLSWYAQPAGRPGKGSPGSEARTDGKTTATATTRRPEAASWPFAYKVSTSQGSSCRREHIQGFEPYETGQRRVNVA